MARDELCIDAPRPERPGPWRVRGRLTAFLLACALAAPSAPARAESSTGAAPQRDADIALAIRHAAHPLSEDADAFDALIAAIGDARIVLLGEDTHGTHEFYAARAQLTRRLIQERGFTGIAIETDLPDAAGTQGYVTGALGADALDAAMNEFKRFPRWMWRNADFRELVHWLRFHNLSRGGAAPVALHGMDLYELRQSIAAVLRYLDQADPVQASRARSRYDCFTAGGRDPQDYGARVAATPADDCREQVADVLADLSTMTAPPPDAPGAAAHFHALQSARAVRAAEEYLRVLWTRPEESWNYRDRHMAASVEALLAHLEAVTGKRSRVVVWAHNAHVGDARATIRGDFGYVSLGQLLRERHGDAVYIVGLTTATGVVRAATDWGGRDWNKRLRPPLAGSLDALLHRAGLPAYYLILSESPALRRALDLPRPERGIGVRYLPALELAGHYYQARAASQFDAILHFDRTTPVVPLPGH